VCLFFIKNKLKGTFVYFFQFCTGIFTAEVPGFGAIVEMGEDECKIDTLSCSKGEQLFQMLQCHNLLRDFPAHFGYMFFKFEDNNFGGSLVFWI